MPNLVHDGDFSVARAVTVPRWSAPFGDNKLVMFDQDYMQTVSEWEPAQLDTTHSEHSDFFLVEESQVVQLGGGVGRWTRTYARVPDDRDEFETFAFRYPGILTITVSIGGSPVIWDGGREPFTRTVVSRLRYEYFHPGHVDGVENVADIPILEGFQLWGSLGRGFPTDYLYSNTYPTAQEYADKMRTTLLVQTSPSPWGSIPIVVTREGSDLVAEDSAIRRWRGNIWERITRYVPTL